ncbi:acetylserotonin O-methyltransferase [Alligator mississippiensis]|uniref:Acetylserotonin O-methyltransferase n=1 Tax=Alligator mississippiensis TaxID=8496 RepID=A0A151NX33_ALLMI|nr:acetylserotonin O-methyltransferase [Alligator mississippiensis]KYO41139.1 acetylserotonin O-methyltransferase [Alligator mississippiensis]
MDSAEDLNYPQILFQYNHGFFFSKTMFTACELGVFDLLLESEEPLSSDVIAGRLGTSTTGMERLLDTCVGLKLLRVELNSEGVFYRNTELSNLYLAKASPKSLYHNMMYYSKTVYLCWHYLTDAVREGKNQYERAFGISSKDLFGAVYRSEEEMIKFMYGLNEIWSICGRDVIAAFDLSPFTHIYDLGGCAGGLAQECISLYPNSTVTIYDLPKVAQVAKERFIPPEEHRIMFHEGDFFKDPVPEADLYILARILHDWPDDKCMHLLEKIHKVCKPGGGVLVVETLLNEDKSGPLDTQVYSLNMLVQAEGKEKTSTEYSNLLRAAGFKEVQVKKTGKLYDAILGKK